MKLRKSLSAIIERLSYSWIGYNIVLVVIAVLLFPAAVFSGYESFVFATFVLYFVLLIPHDYSKFLVGKRDPRKFLMVEKIANWIYRSFWVLLLAFVVIVGLVLAFAFLKLDLNIEVIKIVSFWVPYFFIGTWLYSISMLLYFPRRDESLKLQAQTRLIVFSDALISGNQKEIRGNFHLIKRGIDIINKYFRENFGFAMKEPDKYCDYVKLMTYSDDNKIIEEIHDGLKIVIEELKKKKSDPLCILKGLKRIKAEKISDERLLAEEVTTEMGLKRGFLANLSLIVAIVELISGLIVVISFFVG